MGDNSAHRATRMNPEAGKRRALKPPRIPVTGFISFAGILVPCARRVPGAVACPRQCRIGIGQFIGACNDIDRYAWNHDGSVLQCQ